jgi:hypothetical protein
VYRLWAWPMTVQGQGQFIFAICNLYSIEQQIFLKSTF